MNKTLQLLGLAMRAGKLVTGEELVLRELKARKVYLVILASDTAKNTRKRMQDKCKTYQIPIVEWGLREDLGHAIGKAERVVLGIIDQGLAHLIADSLKN